MESIDGSEEADYCCRANHNPAINEYGYVITWGLHKENEYVQESTILKKIRIMIQPREYCRIINKGKVLCATTLSSSDRFMPVGNIFNNTLIKCTNICNFLVL